MGGAVVSVAVTSGGLYTEAPTVIILPNPNPTWETMTPAAWEALTASEWATLLESVATVPLGETVAVVTALFATDTTLVRLISSCSTLMMALMRRNSVLPVTATEVRNGTGTPRLALQYWPVISITSVTVNTATVLPSPDGIQGGWVTDGYSIMLVGNSYPVTSMASMFSGAGVFPRCYQNVRVQYSYGWVTVPEDMAQACIELVAQRYTRKMHIDQDSISMGGGASQSTQYQRLDIPREVKQVVEHYRIIPIPEL
jgi:hypothetical protein